MIKSKKIWTLAIAQNKIVAARVDVRSQKVVKSFIHDWSPGELNKVFQLVKKHIGSHPVRIILSDDMSFFLGVFVPDDLDSNKKITYIKKQLEKEYPINDGNIYWDFLEVGSNRDSTKVVIYAPNRNLNQELKEAIESNDLNVEMIEPESISVTRHENPIIGIAKRTDSQNLSEKKLDIEIKNDVEEKVTQKKDRKKLFIFLKILVTVALAIVSVGIVYNYYLTQKDKDNTEEITTVNDPTVTPAIAVDPNDTPGLVVVAPTVRELEVSETTISIQNGSGVAGEAAFVEDRLIDNGFENTQIGNADRQDYQTTNLIFKNDIPQEIRESIEQALSEEYELEIQRVDTSEQEFDVVIIIGPRKTE